MKTLVAGTLLALAIATPAVAGPVQTFGNWMIKAGDAQRHFLATHSSAPLSPHCRAVLAHPQKYGTKEVKWCKSQ